MTGKRKRGLPYRDTLKDKLANITITLHEQYQVKAGFMEHVETDSRIPLHELQHVALLA